MACIEQQTNTEHGFCCSIEADRPTEWRSGGCASSFLTFYCHIATHHDSPHDGTAIQMAYKGSFFVWEGPRQAPNDGNDDNDNLLDNDGDHGDGWVIGGLEEVYGMHRHRIRGKEGTEENDRSLGWPECPQQIPYSPATAPTVGYTHPAQHHPLLLHPGPLEPPLPCISHSLSRGSRLLDDTTTGPSMDDALTDLTCPMILLRSHYCAHRWVPPPRPTSSSPTPPRTPRATPSVHIPLFEWGNMAMWLA
ncbi:hypothetical protein IW262DRAFT_1302017 [Armillaria fumosa]|nr:hypothetical protein IW262DRAFT_1302017 [Armillaria fumosa]